MRFFCSFYKIVEKRDDDVLRLTKSLSHLVVSPLGGERVDKIYIKKGMQFYS